MVKIFRKLIVSLSISGLSIFFSNNFTIYISDIFNSYILEFRRIHDVESHTVILQVPVTKEQHKYFQMLLWKSVTFKFSTYFIKFPMQNLFKILQLFFQNTHEDKKKKMILSMLKDQRKLTAEECAERIYKVCHLNAYY